jgi:hypothetical protein
MLPEEGNVMPKHVELPYIIKKRKSAGTAHLSAPQEIKQWQGNIKCLSRVPQILLGSFFLI